MKVILLEDVINLGEMGETVTVKDGYARNFLIPRKMALPATARNLKIQEHQIKGLEQKRAKAVESARSLSDRLADVALSFSRKVGEKGRLFGSVTNMDIAQALGEQGLEIDRRQIVMEEHIKELGEHQVSVKLRSDVTATVSVTVLPEEGGELPMEPAEAAAAPAEPEAVEVTGDNSDAAGEAAAGSESDEAGDDQEEKTGD